MKTPALLVGTALIGISIGFIAGKTGAERGTGAGEDVKEVSLRTKSTRRTDGPAGSQGKADSVASGFSKGREYSKMSAAEALVQMKANADLGWGGDPLESARKNYEYQLMLSKLPLSELEKLITLSQESDLPSYRARAIFGTYASRNLEKATAWAATQPDADSWKGAVVGATAERDPGRAMEIYQESILNGNTSAYGDMMTEGSYGLAGSFAKQGKAALIQFLDSIPSSGAGNLISNSVRHLPKEDLPGFMEDLEKRVKDGKIDQWAVTSALQNIASTDPVLARSLIDKMEAGPERAKRELLFAGALSQKGKTTEAMELVKSAMAQQPGKEKEFFMNESGGMMFSNPTLIAQIAATLPEGSELTVDDVKKISQRTGRVDVVGMAKLLKSPDDQATYLKEAINNLGSRQTKPNDADFRVLEHRLQSLELTGSGAAEVRTAVAAAKEKALGK